MSWSLLVVAQSASNAARMRVWREIKALGAAILRDGVYLLPASEATTTALAALADSVHDAGGQAYLMPVDAGDDQSLRWRELFDRAHDYSALIERAQKLVAQVRSGNVEALRKAARALDQETQAVAAIDYFAGPAREQAQQAVAQAHAAVERRADPTEPRTAKGRMRRIDPADYRKRVWATRAQLWIDRVACAWLILRFIDPAARFVWLKRVADKPKRAVGFDFDGAEFTHRDGRVSFEVMRSSFGRDDDGALLRMGTIVHALDMGGATVAEAAGVESLLAGLRRLHASDDDFLAAAAPAFDGWYAAFSTPSEEPRK